MGWCSCRLRSSSITMSSCHLSKSKGIHLLINMDDETSVNETKINVKVDEIQKPIIVIIRNQTVVFLAKKFVCIHSIQICTNNYKFHASSTPQTNCKIQRQIVNCARISFFLNRENGWNCFKLRHLHRSSLNVNIFIHHFVSIGRNFEWYWQYRTYDALILARDFVIWKIMFFKLPLM